MVRTHAIEAPSGWRRLDAFHSPAETNRFIRDAGGGWHEVVDAGSYGASGTWYVTHSVERGILEEGPDGSRPYIDTEVRSSETLVKDADEKTAFEAARRAMNGGRSADPEFDFGGGL